MPRTPRKKIDTHYRTRDEVSAGAANGPLRVALFRPGSQAVCECEAGDADQARCAALYVFDEGGAHVATFHGQGYRATEEQFPPGSGLSGLCVYRLPARTADGAEALQALQAKIAELNRRNDKFWKKQTEE